MKPTRKLNNNQHTTLLLTHKFRFITSSLLSTHKQVNQSASLRTLETLRKSGYLNRHYDTSYKLLGKSARYYLSKQGIKYLKDSTDIEPLTLNLHYKNKNMGQAYIDQCLETYALYLKLIKQHPDHDIFSRIELSRDQYHLDPKPDLYLESPSRDHKSIFIDIFSNTQTWVIKKRVDAYIKHYEDGEWPEDEYPEVHVYCDSQRQAESVEAYTAKRIEDELLEGLNLMLNIL